MDIYWCGSAKCRCSVCSAVWPTMDKMGQFQIKFLSDFTQTFLLKTSKSNLTLSQNLLKLDLDYIWDQKISHKSGKLPHCVQCKKSSLYDLIMLGIYRLHFQGYS